MSYVLTLSCPDRPGLVFAVTRWIAESGGNILDSQQFTDTSTEPDRGNEFFLRVHFEHPQPPDFTPVAVEHSMDFRLSVAEQPARALVMVSTEGHCLNDLLYRQSTGALHVEIPAIVSNHRDLEKLASSYDVPFHTASDKHQVEQLMLRLVDELDIDVVVLARYMQIISNDACRALEGRMINIHHSFLPSFKGARPYQQAHDRGVKLIGATAHYVTADLDEGPIIDQGVLRVDHRMTAADLARSGRDVEAQTLSRAVALHAESRVLRNGPRTVVFD
ncbi:formyltetrahydrofolate deformylase [Aeromicrobium sp. CF3.5]|uniref:formyltetrahydrofolate deformylase n=1 Tax=Aeromicrobium sp. CF3.5 TaxID=3373078 RepID=UPI003EE776E3